MDSTATFDTAGWRDRRDAKLMEWVGDAYAIEFLLHISRAAEFFDDLIDRDKPYTDGDAITVLFNLTVDLPQNPFFDRFKSDLVPIMSTALNAWVDSIHMERSGEDTGRNIAYVLRFWCIELVMAVVGILRGREYLQSVSMDIRKFFTFYETLEEYKEKLP